MIIKASIFVANLLVIERLPLHYLMLNWVLFGSLLTLRGVNVEVSLKLLNPTVFRCGVKHCEAGI